MRENASPHLQIPGTCCWESWRFVGKSQRVKMQRGKISESFAEEKMFAEDISEDFSENGRYQLYYFRVSLDIFESS